MFESGGLFWKSASIKTFLGGCQGSNLTVEVSYLCDIEGKKSWNNYKSSLKEN